MDYSTLSDGLIIAKDMLWAQWIMLYDLYSDGIRTHAQLYMMRLNNYFVKSSEYFFRKKTLNFVHQ